MDLRSALEDKKEIIIVGILGVMAAYLLLRFLPAISENMLFVYGIPVVGLLLLALAINPKLLLILLLFSRSLLDPLLELTKVEIFGVSVGLGGAINLLIIMFAFYLFIHNPRPVIRNDLMKPWAVFLLVLFAASVYSPVQKTALKTFLATVTAVCAFLIPYAIMEKKSDRNFWIKVLLFSSFLPFIFAIGDWVTGATFYTDAGLRIRGTFPHPNILAFYITLIIMVIFYILKSPGFRLGQLELNLLRAYMFGLFILLLGTKTRSAWAACWVFFFMYGLLKEKKYILYTVVLPPVFLLHSAVLERIKTVSTDYTPGRRMSSLTWRLRLWEDSWPLIKENILLGQGLASFQEMSQSFFEFARFGRSVHAHNAFVELLFETGIVGLVSYLSIYIVMLRRFYKRMKEGAKALSAEYAVAICCVISYLTVCASDNMLHYLAFNLYFWFFMGILLSGMRFDDEKNGIGDNPVV